MATVTSQIVSKPEARIQFVCSAHFPLDLHVHFPVAQHSQTLFGFFHPLCTLWVTSAYRSPSSANVDPRYVKVFTLFTVSHCKWISVSWCSLHLNTIFSILSTKLQSSLFHCSSSFPKLPFYMVSSSTAQHNIVCKQHTPRRLLFDAPSHHIQYHVKQVGTQWGSLV